MTWLVLFLCFQYLYFSVGPDSVLSVILWALSRIIPKLPSANLTLQHVTNLFTLFKLAHSVQFLFNTDCFLPIFHLDCTRWCRVIFLTHFGNKHQCCWGELHQLHYYFTNTMNPYTWWLAWQWCPCLLASKKTRAAIDHVYQSVLNQKLSCKFKKWCKFSSHIKAKSCKKK